MSKMLKNLLIACLLLASATAWAQSAIVPGDVLAMLRPGVEPKVVADDLARVQGQHVALQVVREVSAPMRAWLFHFGNGDIPQEAMLRAFRAHPGVQLAQSNHVIQERETTPDDPLFTQQWWHQNIQSEGAWDITTGGVTATGDTIVVAIIEKADLTHPDLAANAWANHGEVAGNGIDDDGNGYVDDVRGWDPVTGNDNVYSGSHGTRVAGMIGAVGNNGDQVVGANWQVKMMPVHYQNAQEANVLSAYTYPLVMRRLYNSTGGAKGAFVVATNASWGVDGGQPSDAPLWCAMYDTLGAAGVLNCASTTNNNVNVDVVGDLPTACPSNFMISVTATNSSDMRTFSGWGATTVDVGAPGDNVLTTTIGGGTGTTSGTSFASPLTAGVVALLYSVPCTSLAVLAHNDPTEAALRVRQALLNGVDQVGNLPGNTVTGGRINAFNSAQLLMDSCQACPPPYNIAVSSDAIGSATVEWTALPGTITLNYRPQGTSTWTVIAGITGSSQALTGLAACQAYEFQLSTTCNGGEDAVSPILTWTSEGCCTAPLNLAVEAVDSTGAMVTWSTVLASESYDLRYRVVGAGGWTELHGLSGNSTTIDGLAPCSDIEVQMGSTCGPTGSSWSASVFMHVPGCGQCVEGTFCESGGENTSFEWIALVALEEINRPSGSDGGYADIDVTGQTTTLDIGASYVMQLAPGYSSFAYMESFTVWMDLDRDGQFTAAEQLLQLLTNSTTPTSGTITIPATATPGPARLRVLMKDTSHPADGCQEFQYGETEDYCVTLSGPAGIAGLEGTGSIKLWPQPADQELHVHAPQAVASRLVITDISGRAVQELPLRSGSATVATGQLGAGVYLYRLEGGGRTVARGSFVVAH